MARALTGEKLEKELLRLEGMLEYEKKYQAAAFVCGVDEAGRGPLAGPVCAGAVILPKELCIPGLDDSKKLSDKKRRALYDVICEKALCWGVGLASVEEIEEHNILGATFMAMNRAVDDLNTEPDFCLVDGNNVSGIHRKCQCVIGGDGRSANIAAASIIAKVTRDRLMEKYADKYPQYAFEKHKGYGTKLHYERLREFGPCPIHRMSFLKKMH